MFVIFASNIDAFIAIISAVMSKDFTDDISVKLHCLMDVVICVQIGNRCAYSYVSVSRSITTKIVAHMKEVIRHNVNITLVGTSISSGTREFPARKIAGKNVEKLV